MYREITEKLIAFIEKNPTPYHAVASIAQVLDGCGYTQLLESKSWSVEKGGKYYVCRNGSSIIAFTVGSELEDLSFNICSSHTDSPAFKLKELAEMHTKDKYTRLNTEGYGGMICASWMDRPLSLAGRVMVKAADGSIETKLINFNKDMLIIPNVAIHMNREANDGFKFNKQVDMLPLMGAGSEVGALKNAIAAELGVEVNDILGTDLFVYSREKAVIWGLNDEFVSCGRLDDQQCAFSSLEALIQAENSKSVNVLACFDNEEVGSGTKQGADSSFLYDVLKRIAINLGKSEEDYIRSFAASFMISADNAHAVHPNHPEHTDVDNCTYMNEGIVVKSHAGQKYTSDAMSIAIIKELAARAEVPLQYFSNRSDKNGGSTLGNISQSHVSLNTVDLGIPQLAMHSTYETSGVKDTLYMVKLMKQLYCSHFEETGSGIVKIN